MENVIGDAVKIIPVTSPVFSIDERNPENVIYGDENNLCSFLNLARGIVTRTIVVKTYTQGITAKNGDIVYVYLSQGDSIPKTSHIRAYVLGGKHNV